MIQKKQNNYKNLPTLSSTKYENYLNVVNGSYYNLLEKIFLDKNQNESLYEEVTIDSKVHWTTLAYNHFGTIDLWWIILCFNGIQDATKLPRMGQVIKIPKPEIVNLILNQLNAK